MGNGLGLLLAFAAAKLAIHLAVGEGYGYFRDEFYYLACAEHLDWGYVDHPPLSIVLLWISRRLLGDSVVAIHLLPALAGAATVFLAGWMARELGGKWFAQALAMTATIAAPQFLGASSYYSMNGYDLLVWALAAAILIRLGKDPSTRLWLLLGVVLGLGLLNKISVLWLGMGLAAGLLLTGRRRALATPGPWLAAGVAGLLFLPHLLWQIAHGWPTLEFIRNATGEKMRTIAPAEFLGDQILSLHPLTLPVWAAGLAWLLLAREGRRHRLLGVLYLAVFALLMTSRTARPGYLGPAYVMLFAAGGVAWERLLRPVARGWLRPALLALLAAGGAVLAPFALPVLPVETYVAYAARMGIGPSTSERKELRELPQHYADRHGWGELVEVLAGVHGALPPGEREAATIFTYNYGEAGAIDLLGRERGLPRAISGHNNYWLWGPRGYSGEVVIVVGGSEEGHRRRYLEVERVAQTDCRFCMPYEDDQPISVLRGPRRPLASIWPELKHFD